MSDNIQSQSTLLRTLSEKAYLKFGRYSDLRVREVLMMGSKGKLWLVWSYYNSSMISYSEEILTTLGVTKEHRIEKPGCSKEAHNIFKKTFSEEESAKDFKYMNQSIRTTNKRAVAHDRRNSYAKSLQRKNHGNS